MEHFFPPNSSGDLRSDAHQSQIIWGEADVDHTQIIGGGYSQNIWGIYPPIPPPSPLGFGTPAQAKDQEYRSKCSPKTKQNKKFFKNFFQAISKKAKKVLANFPQSFWHFPTKFWPFKEYSAVLGQGHGNFRGLEASRPTPGTWPLTPKPRTSKWVLEAWTSSRTPSLIITLSPCWLHSTN